MQTTIDKGVKAENGLDDPPGADMANQECRRVSSPLPLAPQGFTVEAFNRRRSPSHGSPHAYPPIDEEYET